MYFHMVVSMYYVMLSSDQYLIITPLSKPMSIEDHNYHTNR